MSHDSPLELFLSKLTGVTNSGNGYEACCPAHDDGRASLSVSEGDDGRVLVYCHAGCTAEAICSAIGLKASDLFRSPLEGSSSMLSRRDGAGGKPAGKAFAMARDAVAELERKHGPRSASWTYHNSYGEPAILVVRWNRCNGTKDIRPVSKHVDGFWRIGGMPEPRPLYGLPYLAGAQRDYVCEGEKAADAARSIGLVATTSAHGANSPDKTDWSPLAGKEVVILPDNDPPGRKYADEVASILARLKPAPTVKILDLPGLPEHGDIVDWLEKQMEGGRA